ncbi:transposase [Kribbella deserti]|uniref:Transposase n=1 Tax=Kribbella deserti TaxID=1926257 RepID=A0ABV6QX22_9ACTN
MVYVLTVDQRDSRRTADLVPELLARLNASPRRPGLLRRFERTAGDEVQGVFSAAGPAIDVVVELLRTDRWNIGVGAGPVLEPLPRSTRAGQGPAFVHARDAVTKAKSSPHHVNVEGSDARQAEQVETVLWLLASVLRRRSQRGWEVADLLAAGMSRSEVGAKLGISQSAVTQRAQAAGIAEEVRGRALATELLSVADVGVPS